jgi:dehydratase
MRVRRSVLRTLGVASIIGLTAVLTACDPPTSVTTPISWDCDINPNHFLLPHTQTTLAADYTTTGPQAVAPNGNFTIKIVPEPFVVDGTPTGAGTVTQISNVVWRFAVPPNTSLTGHTISDWSGVGAGTPTSAVNGSTIEVTVPGPIPSNTTATFPTVTMSLQANGPLGARIEPRFAGTSYAAPGLTLDSRVTGTILGTLNPTLACFPNPSPALHSILISSDTASPAITITSPTNNQSIVQGSSVLADYACNDGTGTGVASCIGTVADGATIDTSTLGAHTFTVTATDNQGLVGTKNVTYNVV